MSEEYPQPRPSPLRTYTEWSLLIAEYADLDSFVAHLAIPTLESLGLIQDGPESAANPTAAIVIDALTDLNPATLLLVIRILQNDGFPRYDGLYDEVDPGGPYDENAPYDPDWGVDLERYPAVVLKKQLRPMPRRGRGKGKDGKDDNTK